MLSIRLLLSSLLSALSLGAVFLPAPSIAEDQSSERAAVKIVVRTIQAAGSKAETATQSLDDSLNDLKPKLEMLPFASFKLLSSKEEQISLKRKETVGLPNGQSLAFRPMYVNKERVGIWLSWKDSDGSDILNTRLHFDADESVLTGTDYPNNEGRIIAIKALQDE